MHEIITNTSEGNRNASILNGIPYSTALLDDFGTFQILVY